MTKHPNSRGTLIVLGSLVLCSSLAAAAQYPDKPVRLVVPYTPGGNTDVLARLIAHQLTQIWSQQVIVDNRPGGNTVIGTELVARAPADGYTLLFTTLTFSVLPSLQQKLPFDPLRDFSPVSLAVTLPNALAVTPSLPVKSVAELIRHAKANPGKLSYASSGVGTSPHLSMELLKAMAGFDMTLVPYKGGAPALTAAMSGEVAAVFAGLPIVIPHNKSGKLRLVGVTGAKRSAAAPDTPAIAETVPGYQVDPWFGMLAPARVSPALVSRLQASVREVLDSASVKAHLQREGAEPVAGTPQEFARHIQAEIAKWRDLSRKLGGI
ncbi:MAG: tripartite tricarboxylate transporter substrate binding protein [Burkholderiales bacterium]|nr:tripartite tricarboxylate transporter substrate binding protein [Burkholderiales bacterium]